MSGHCLVPFTIVHEDGLVDRVRCGRCRYCRLRRKMAWVGRMRLELAAHAHGRFLTLTYAADPGELDVGDLQRFMKRYRHHYGECRYFAVGEYGEARGRGHWHVIVFGHQAQVRGRWPNNRAWSEGFSYDGVATPASIAYCAGYVLKGKVHGREPVTMQSLRPGIGFGQIEKMARACVGRGIASWPTFYFVEGSKYPLCEGGLLCFIRAYTNAGGRPPELLTPEERSAVAKAELCEWGSRIRDERTAAMASRLDVGADAHGLQKRR